MFNFLKDYETVNDSLVEKALDNYIELHNSTIKYSTLYKPNDIRDITDPVLINEIKLNIIKKTKKHIIEDDEILDTGKKLLLWNNIKLDKGKYVFISKEIVNYSYPCIFSKYINNNLKELYQL